jgi:hypothetical protein
MYMEKILCNSSLNAGFEVALSARYSFAAASTSGSSSGMIPLNTLITVEYSLSVTATSVCGFATETGLIAGTTASAMARSVFHCSGDSGSSVGRGGNGVAFGDTGFVGRDMLAGQVGFVMLRVLRTICD